MLCRGSPGGQFCSKINPASFKISSPTAIGRTCSSDFGIATSLARRSLAMTCLDNSPLIKSIGIWQKLTQHISSSSSILMITSVMPVGPGDAPFARRRPALRSSVGVIQAICGASDGKLKVMGFWGCNCFNFSKITSSVSVFSFISLSRTLVALDTAPSRTSLVARLIALVSLASVLD